MKFRRLLLGSIMVGGIAAYRALRRQARSIELRGRVALVTGGSRGLGLVMARQLAEEGARVVICARDEEELISAADDLSAITRDFLTVPCDITHQEEVKKMFASIREQMGEVEVVINNAGIIQVGPAETMTQEDFENAMQVHFWGPYYVINEALEDMKRRGAGRIANIISINGKVSFPHLLPYTVSKYALSGYSEGLSAEVARYGIRLTSVYPGLMRTGSPRNIDVKGQNEKEYAWFKIADSIPLLTEDAEVAASKVIKAVKAGDKVLSISLPTRLAFALEGLAPSLNLSFFDLANRFLPKADGTGAESWKAYENESQITQSELTKTTQKAAKKYNEK